MLGTKKKKHLKQAEHSLAKSAQKHLKLEEHLLAKSARFFSAFSSEIFSTPCIIHYFHIK